MRRSARLGLAWVWPWSGVTFNPIFFNNAHTLTIQQVRLICSHGRVQPSSCAVVGTLSWLRMSVGCLWGTVLVRCALSICREGVPADVWWVRWQVFRF